MALLKQRRKQILIYLLPEMKKTLFLFSSVIFLFVSAQSQSPDMLKIRNYRTAHEKDFINEFISFLSIPNVAIDTVNLQKSAAFVMEMMKKRGIHQIQLLSPTTIGT